MKIQQCFLELQLKTSGMFFLRHSVGNVVAHPKLQKFTVFFSDLFVMYSFITTVPVAFLTSVLCYVVRYVRLMSPM